jgi:heat shock protein HslJ
MTPRFYALILVLVILLAVGCAPGPATPAGLTGVEWKLSELNGKAPLAGSHVTLKLENGKAGGSAGCNSYGGSYTLHGATIAFQEVFSTMMACADSAMMDQETAYLQALNQAASLQVSGGRLEIKNQAGETVLAFSK